MKQRHQKPFAYPWDTNAITPGTEFMDSLMKGIKKEITQNPKYKEMTVFFSSAGIPQEGEHKLINHIRQNRPATCQIYGLDADLIFLSLLTEAEDIQILLMRE